MTKTKLGAGQYPASRALEICLPSTNIGKTAPRLVRDLAHYDPRHKAKSGFNILSDTPLWEDDRFKASPDQGRGSCKHEWMLDQDHSSLLEPGKLPVPQSAFSVVAHCSLCRSHLAVILDFSSLTDEDVFLPCPNIEAPLHHLVHRPKESQNLPSIHPDANPILWFDTQVFQCSSQTCAAKVSVTFRPARLPSKWIYELTDKNAINERAKRAIQSDPERYEGHAPPSPVDVLTNLRTYIYNGMQSNEQRRIIGANKKWRLCFGDSCADLLRYLGFQRDVSQVPW